MISEKELAGRFGRSVLTLWRWRQRGIAPPFYRVNGCIYYRWSEVEKWLQERKKSQT